MATLTGTLSFESAKFTVSASYALTTTATGAKISFTSVSAKCTNYTVPDMELVVHVDVLGPTSAESASWNLYTYNGTFTKGKEYTRTVSKSLSVTKTTSAKTFRVMLAVDGYVTATVTVPALASYSVSFNANGGTGAPSAQTKWYGKTLTLSSAKPTRTNYVFKNWNTKSDGSGTSYSPGGSYTGNLAMTLYAQWYAPYTVSYNANGHGTAPSSQVKVYNKALSLAGSMGQQGDYMFRSWNTKADGTGTAYAAGASYSGNANMTLYAIWYAPYAVYYNANGGSAPPATQHKVHGKALTLSTQVPTRTNYVFNGWNTNAAGTGTSYAKGASYTANASVTLYAKWIAPYTVTFDGNGGKGLASGVKVHGQDYTIPSTTPALADATFTGWNTKADGTGTAYAAGSKYAANANLKLYAQWRRHPGVTSYKVQRQSYDEDASAWVNDDEGTAALVTVSWRADVRYAPPTSGKSLSFTLQAYTSAAMTTAVGSAASVTASSASKSDSKLSYGTFSVRLGGPFAADSAYHVKATVKDAYGQTATRALVVPRSSFAIDVHPDGYVGFGGSAVSGAHRFYGDLCVGDGTGEGVLGFYGTYGKRNMIRFVPGSDQYGDGVIVGGGGSVVVGSGESAGALYAAEGVSGGTETLYLASDGAIEFRPNCNTIANRRRAYLASDNNLVFIDPDHTVGTAPSADTNSLGGVFVQDSQGRNVARFLGRYWANGRTGALLEAYRPDTDTWNYVHLMIDASGNRYVSVSDAAAWRNALGASSGVWPASTLPTVTRSNTTATASPAHSGTFTAVDSVSTDSYGRVTGVRTKTVTLPASGNTDTKYKLSTTAVTTTSGVNTLNAGAGKVVEWALAAPSGYSFMSVYYLRTNHSLASSLGSYFWDSGTMKVSVANRSSSNFTDLTVTAAVKFYKLETV